MSNNPKVTIGVDNTTDAVVKWYDDSSSSPQVSMKYDADVDYFKLNKRISNTDTEIMRIDEDGKVTFLKNVSFEGGSTNISTNTAQIEDQQLEIGLIDSLEIDSISISGSGPYTYQITITSPRADGSITFAKGSYVYFQNTYSASNTLESSFQNAFLVLGDNTSPTGNNPTTTTFEISKADSITLDIANHPPIVSKLTNLTDNTGVHMLAVDGSGNLVSGKIAYDGNTNKALQIENTSGKIQMGSESVNEHIDIGTGGTRTITIGKTGSTVKLLGNVNVSSSENSADAIKLHADAGASQTITIVNDEGTNESAIALTATAGGVDIDAAAGKDVNISGGQVTLSSKTNEASAISLTTNQGTSETIVVTNTQGTDNAAIALTASAGGITMKVADEKDLTMGNAAGDAYFKVAASATAGNEDLRIVNTNGTDNGSIELTASAGGIDINANTQITIDSGTGLSLDAGAASNFTTSAGAITLEGNAGINLNEGGATILAIDDSRNITTTNTAQIDIDCSGSLSLNSSGGVINIGNDSVSQNINMGTNGTRTITIGKDTNDTSLFLKGNITATGEFGSESDVRLKKDILTIDNSLEKVNNLTGVTFKWKADPNEKLVMGFIAQEVEEVVPELTRVNDRGYLTVNYLGTTALLVEAVKEQQKMIEQLQYEVANLKAMVKDNTNPE